MSEVMLNDNNGAGVPPPPVVDEDKNKPILFMGKPLNNQRDEGPLKALLYGINGVGKSHLLHQMPAVCHIDTEGNIEHLPDKNYVPADSIYDKKRVTSFSEVLLIIDALITEPHQFKTLGIDSLTTLNTLCLEKIREEYKGDKMELTRYGTEYRLCAAEMVKLLQKLDILRQRRKMHILITCQSKTKMVQNPLIKAYDRCEPDVNEATARIFMDWVSCIFYAQKGIYSNKDDQAQKALATKTSKDRVMVYNKRGEHDAYLYTDGNAAYCAKNIYQLPDVIKMDWKILSAHIQEYFEDNK